MFLWSESDSGSTDMFLCSRCSLNISCDKGTFQHFVRKYLNTQQLMCKHDREEAETRRQPLTGQCFNSGLQAALWYLKRALWAAGERPLLHSWVTEWWQKIYNKYCHQNKIKQPGGFKTDFYTTFITARVLWDAAQIMLVQTGTQKYSLLWIQKHQIVFRVTSRPRSNIYRCDIQTRRQETYSRVSGDRIRHLNPKQDVSDHSL